MQLAITTLLCAASLAQSARPVDRYTVQWATPPGPGGFGIPTGRPGPPAAPYAGNGDVEVMYTGGAPASRHDDALSWQQWLYMSKNDMWGSDSVSYYPHLSAGKVGILVIPSGCANGTNANGTVTMVPGNASIVHALAAAGGAVLGATRVLENNVVATTLTCVSAAGGACAVTLALSDTDGNHYGVAQDAGAAPDGSLVWWRKENLHGALNPAYTGSCSPLHPLQSTERAFTVDTAGFLSMANGSCLWSDPAASPGMVTTGACVAPQGVWKWSGAAAGGDILHVASSTCLSAALALGACGAAPWAQAPAGDGNASHVFLNSTQGVGCIISVPDNNNNTLGVALGVADAAGNLVSGAAARVSPSNPSAGMTLSLSLASGAEYTLLIGLQTLRDIGCAGIRPQWVACTTAPQEAAAALVEAMAATAARGAAVAASDAFWAGYWAASSVDIASRAAPNATAQLGAVERWYYLAQYLLACTTRDGKVTSALDGFVCVEPVPWGDQFTLDYNLEATFWGAGSSNHLDFIHPVMASTTNPGAVATARLRAQNPGVWNRGNDWPGKVGRTVPAAMCIPDCPNLTTTGFQG